MAILCNGVDFVSKSRPFLGASPDGLIGRNGPDQWKLRKFTQEKERHWKVLSSGLTLLQELMAVCL